MSGFNLQTLKKFPRAFWVAQMFELLERGAYYTMIPIIVVHAMYNVGLPVWLAAMITVFMYPIQYGLPILSGALGEKIGYKRQIIFSFIVLTLAYFFLAFAFNAVTMILAVMAVGLGIGSYKPLVSATVAKATSDKDRNLAYSIYYWVVNLGAFVFPLLFVLFEWAGYISRETYAMVFIVDGLMVGINIFIAAFLFEEIPRSGKVKTVGDALNNIKIALADRKFMYMILLIGGFWALYSSFLNALPVVLFGFKLVPAWFTPMLLGVFNPLTIIALGMPIGKYTEKIESLKVLMGGVVLYLIGLTIIGLTLSWMWVIVGIIIASMGEFMVAPGYLSFVSKLAPKEKVSAYIGCNFLATVIGLAGGTFFISILVTYVGVDMQRPHLFYGILIAAGILLLVGFIVYYYKWGQDIIERARRIREMEEGVVEEEDEEEEVHEPAFFRMFDHKSTVIVSLLIVPIILFATYSQGTNTYYGTEEEVAPVEKFNLDSYTATAGPHDNFGGTVAEGESVTENFTVELEKGQLLKSITFTLKWTDEDDFVRIIRTWENQPDEFALSVSNGGINKTASGANVHGEEGTITITIDFTPTSADDTNGTGDWTIVVELTNAGDFVNPFSPLVYVDDSNSFDLTVETEIYTKG